MCQVAWREHISRLRGGLAVHTAYSWQAGKTYSPIIDTALCREHHTVSRLLVFTWKLDKGWLASLQSHKRLSCPSQVAAAVTEPGRTATDDTLGKHQGRQTCAMEIADWQAHLSALQCNHHMFQNQIHCDVTFRVGSRGQVLGAHRYVLESRSDVFTVMFHGPLAETGVIEVPEVELDDFKDFLRFLYTDDGPVDADSVLVLLYLAKKYNVDTLVQRCVAFLADNLCTDTACFLMEQGHIFSEEGLRLKALHYICEHARTVLNGPHVHDLCNRCLAAVFRSDLLRAPETEVYECAMRWAAAECERRGRAAESGWERRSVLGASFSYIRFPLLPPRYFLDHVMRYDILTMREKLELTRFFLDSEKYPLQTFSARPRAYKEPPPPPLKKKPPLLHAESAASAVQQSRGGRQAAEQGQFLAGTVDDVRRRLSARQRGITRGISFAARLSIFESL